MTNLVRKGPPVLRKTIFVYSSEEDERDGTPVAKVRTTIFVYPSEENERAGVPVAQVSFIEGDPRSIILWRGEDDEIEMTAHTARSLANALVEALNGVSNPTKMERY